MTAPQDFKLTDGTVIDHMPVGTAVRALELLGLPREGPVTVGINVPSSRSGHKDIVRGEGMELERSELNRLALLGPDMTVSIVKNGEVAGKTQLEVPQRLLGILTCSNSTCITHSEEMQTVFLRVGDYPYRFKCAYCERVRAAVDRPRLSTP